MDSATTFTSTTTATAASSCDNSRRNSFSSFVKHLLLLVSPSTDANDDEKEDCLSKTTSSEHSPFQDLYFSFPAFEEPEESTSCGQSHHQSFITESSRIMC